MRWWGRLLLAIVLLNLLIATRYFAVTEFESSAGAWVFRVVMLPAHLLSLSFLWLVPVLLFAILWPRPRWVIPLGTIWATAILLALLIDTQVYQLYRFHVNAGVLNLLLGGAASETFIFPGVMYAQAALIAAGMLVLVAIAAQLLWRDVKRRRQHRGLAWAAAALSVTCIVAFHAAHTWADVLAYEPIMEQTEVLPLRYAATAKRFLRARGIKVRNSPVTEFTGKSDRSGMSYPLQPLDCRAPAAAPNIIFIVIDSWRFDEINAQVTPHIEEFSRRGVRFLDHRSGGNATRIGMFSLFYSIPGTYWSRMLNERQGPVFIGELLRQAYDVRPFRSAPIYSPEFDRTIFAELAAPRLRSEGDGPADWDRDLTADFIRYLEQRTNASPFFALLFFDSPHSFQIPESYPQVFSPSAAHVNYLRLTARTDKLPLLNRYRNSLHYVDSLVGEVLKAAQAHGLLENTIIVITGDHGQEFNDSGRNYWGHGSNFTRYQTGVPLILYAPDLAPGSRRHRTTHFDVAPTLLRKYLGCRAPLDTYSVGRSLFEPGGREPLVLSEYADFAIVHGERIAVVSEYGLQVFGPDYTRLNVALDRAAVRAAIEQKTRFK